MLELDVLLAAAGATGFTFGLVRTRWSDRRSARAVGGSVPAEPAAAPGEAPAVEAASAVPDPDTDDGMGRVAT